MHFFQRAGHRYRGSFSLQFRVSVWIRREQFGWHADDDLVFITDGLLQVARKAQWGIPRCLQKDKKVPFFCRERIAVDRSWLDYGIPRTGGDHNFDAGLLEFMNEALWTGALVEGKNVEG